MNRTDEFQIGRGSPSSRHENRNSRQRHASGLRRLEPQIAARVSRLTLGVADIFRARDRHGAGVNRRPVEGDVGPMVISD
jgi:hypothetical protein